MIEQRYKLPSIDISKYKVESFDEAYLELYSLDHLRPSYTAWIFFTQKLAKVVTLESDGYAGSFAIFGHSDCWGSEGHCDVPSSIRRFDTRRSHHLTPTFKRVLVTHALKKSITSGKKSLDIRIYAHSREDWPNRLGRPLISCGGIQLVTIQRSSGIVSTSKSDEGSALPERKASNEKALRSAAKAFSNVLQDGRASRLSESAAGSELSQRPSRKNKHP